MARSSTPKNRGAGNSARLIPLAGKFTSSPASSRGEPATSPTNSPDEASSASLANSGKPRAIMAARHETRLQRHPAAHPQNLGSVDRYGPARPCLLGGGSHERPRGDYSARRPTQPAGAPPDPPLARTSRPAWQLREPGRAGRLAQDCARACRQQSLKLTCSLAVATATAVLRGQQFQRLLHRAAHGLAGVIRGLGQLQLVVRFWRRRWRWRRRRHWLQRLCRCDHCFIFCLL